MKMLDASEVQDAISAMQRRINEGFAAGANDLAKIRQGLAAAREARDAKLENLSKRQAAIDTEAAAAHDNYRKAETEAMTALATLEQSLRLPEPEQADTPELEKKPAGKPQKVVDNTAA